MGNELFSNYSLDRNNYLQGGHMKLWKIFKAYHKERKTQVRVFVFDKKDLENYPQSEREDLLIILRKEASNLMKFKHPNILSIIEPLAEDKYSISFITENFNYSLSSWVKDYNPSKLECKLIMNDLVKTIGFLHNNCHVIHTNLNPDTIFINDDNRIKLSGMNFYFDASSTTTVEEEGNKKINSDGNFKYSLINYYSSILNQNLNYMSPEIILNNEINLTSDIFSIGALIYFLLSDNNTELLNLDSNTVENYKKVFSGAHRDSIYDKITETDDNILEKDDKEIIQKCIVRDANERIDVKEVLELEWFTDYKLKALCFIENLPTNDIVKNYDFLKKLPQLLKIFEFKIIKNRFLNALLGSLRIESLINPIIPAIFAICELENIDLDFEEIVWPKFKELFQMKTIPTACLYFLLSKMTFIGSRISHEEFSKFCIPFVCKAMDCGVSKIQGVVVDNLSFVSNNIDNNMFFNQIYPRIIQILLHTKSNTLKIRLLNSIKNLYGLLDQNMINNNLLNDLEKLRKIDLSGNTAAGIILIYEEIMDNVTIESIRKKIFPSLLSILTESNISKNTYERVTSLMEAFMKKIKSAREKDLTDNDDFEVELLDPKENEKRMKNIIANEDNKEFLINFFNVNSPDVSSITSPDVSKDESSEINSNSDAFKALKRQNKLMENLSMGNVNSNNSLKKQGVTFSIEGESNNKVNNQKQNEYKVPKSCIMKIKNKKENDGKEITTNLNNDKKLNNSMSKIARGTQNNNVFDSLLNDFEKEEEEEINIKPAKISCNNIKNKDEVGKEIEKIEEVPKKNIEVEDKKEIKKNEDEKIITSTKDKKETKKEKEVNNKKSKFAFSKSSNGLDSKININKKEKNLESKESKKHNRWDSEEENEEDDEENILKDLFKKENKKEDVKIVENKKEIKDNKNKDETDAKNLEEVNNKEIEVKEKDAEKEKEEEKNDKAKIIESKNIKNDVNKEVKKEISEKKKNNNTKVEHSFQGKSKIKFLDDDEEDNLEGAGKLDLESLLKC